MRKIVDLTGKKFNKLIVLRMLDEKDSSNNIQWECQCECGNIHIVTGSNLKSGGVKSCGCLHQSIHNKNPDRIDAIYKQLYTKAIIRRSKKLHQNYDITLEDFIHISQQPCYYCGESHSNYAKDRFGKNGKLTSDTIVYYNGLDRIDSKLGYTIDNVVPCCKHCNSAKGAMSQDDFIQWVIKVYNHQAKD